MSKYNATKFVVDGIVFDSKMESDYYLYLKGEQAKGYVKSFELQPEFELIPKFEKNGKKYRPMKYKADFKVIYPNGDIIIVDVKGFTTTDFRIKEKLFNYKYDYPLILITYSKRWGGWLTLDELVKLRKEAKKNKEK